MPMIRPAAIALAAVVALTACSAPSFAQARLGTIDFPTSGSAAATPVEFGPPAVIKPSHELFGEMLLEVGMPREAHAEFNRALELAPKRAHSLLGLARAAKAMGDSVGAAKGYTDLLAVWHRADPAVRAINH